MLRRSPLLYVAILLSSISILTVDAFFGEFGTLSLSSLGRAIAPWQRPRLLSSPVVQHPSFRLLAKSSDNDATQKFLSNWMEKNEWFSTPMTRVRQNNNNNNNNNKHRMGPSSNRGQMPPPLPPRILLHGLPQSTTWQQIKDHCQEVCNESALFVQLNTINATTERVADAENDNPTTITTTHTRSAALQFKTKRQATRAFAALSNHTINDQIPQVSWEEQPANGDPNGTRESHRRKEFSIWRCASMDRGASIPSLEWDGIQQLMQERQAARKRRDFPVADRIRDTLKSTYNVIMDDRTMLWWTESAVADESLGGGERWAPWRRIPTHPQHDRVVEEAVVSSLLDQRDQARTRKDFKTADALLDQVEHSSCASDKYVIRVHDPSRTWRVWILNRGPRTRSGEQQQQQQQQQGSYPKNNTTRTD